MTVYERATDILDEKGLSDFLTLYGIEDNSDPIRAFAAGRFPTKKDPATKMGAAGMQSAMLIAGPDTPLQIYAGFDLSPAEQAGFTTGPAKKVTGKGSDLSLSFAEILIQLARAARPLVIFTTGSSYERALSRVNVSCDPSVLRISGETEMEIDLERTAQVHALFARLPGIKPFEMKGIRQRCDLHALGILPDPLAEGGATRAKIVKALGYKGRLSAADAVAVREDIGAFREDLMQMPSTDDPAWIMAQKIAEQTKEKQDA